MSGSPEIAKILLLHGANPNYGSTNFSPLYWAVYRNNSFDMVNVLLAGGAEDNYTKSSGVAKQAQTAEMLQLLISKRPIKIHDESKVLEHYLKEFRPQFAEVVLENGANPNGYWDGDVGTYLQMACMSWDCGSCCVLLSYGANPCKLGEKIGFQYIPSCFNPLIPYGLIVGPIKSYCCLRNIPWLVGRCPCFCFKMINRHCVSILCKCVAGNSKESDDMARKYQQQEEADKLGLDVELLTSYNKLLSDVNSYKAQLQHKETQEMIDQAQENPALVKTLVSKRKNLPTLKDKVSLSNLKADIVSYKDRLTLYYNKITSIEGFDLMRADVCANHIKVVSDLVTTFKDENEKSLLSSQIIISIDATSQDASPIQPSTDVSKSPNSTDDIDGIEEETYKYLGLSPELLKQYSQTLDTLQAWVDQPKVLELSAQIKKATDDFDPILVKQLLAYRKNFKCADHILTLPEVSETLYELQRKLKKFYVDMISNENFIVSDAEKCIKALKYVNSLIPITTNDILVEKLEKRFSSKSNSSGDIDFPARIKRLQWTNIKVSTVNLSDIVLGEGTFSRVYKAQLIQSNGLFDIAIKLFNQSSNNLIEYKRQCAAAIEEATTILSLTDTILNRDAIISVYGVVAGPLSPELVALFQLPDGFPRVGLVMRLEAGGSIERALYPAGKSLKRKMDLEFKLTVLRNVSDAMREIHLAGGIHGDIKPQNVLFSDNITATVRLADFGLSDIRSTYTTNKQGSTIGLTTANTKGTLPYCAPEMLPHFVNGFTAVLASRKTDMYAFGIFAFELLAESKPFVVGDQELIMKVHNNERPDLSKLPDNTPPGIVDMIIKCWHVDRSIRLTAADAYSTILHNLQVVSSKQFDIFFSHAWVDKCVLANIHVWLTKLGYRVWYDANEMGYNLQDSMRNGIKRSTIVLACLNNTYQDRPNCMFELRETARLHPNKPIVALVLEVLSGPPTKRMWANKMAPVSQELEGLAKFSTLMYCDISGVAKNPLWANPDQVPPDLVQELSAATQPLVKILHDVNCLPSNKI